MAAIQVEPGLLPLRELPRTRLELLWVETTAFNEFLGREAPNGWVCKYRMHIFGHEEPIPLPSSNATLCNSPLKRTKQRISVPYYPGETAQRDATRLGNIPVFVVCGLWAQRLKPWRYA